MIHPSEMNSISKVNNKSIFDDPRPPFHQTSQPKVKNLDALKRSLIMCQKLNATTSAGSPGTDSTTQSIQLDLSKFKPPPLLISSMEKLIDFENKKHKSDTDTDIDTSSKGSRKRSRTHASAHARYNTSVNSPENESENRLEIGKEDKKTPRMIQRNSSGGRAWLAQTTPRTNSRGKRRRYGNRGRKVVDIQDLHSSYENDVVKSEKTGAVPQIIECKKEKRLLSPVEVSDARESEDEDFAFHSQSSMPNKFE